MYEEQELPAGTGTGKKSGGKGKGSGGGKGGGKSSGGKGSSKAAAHAAASKIPGSSAAKHGVPNAPRGATESDIPARSKGDAELVRRLLAKDLHHYLSESAMGSPLGIMSRDERFDLNALMGAPFKFSETDDPPLPGTVEFGRSYAKQFLSWGQIVTFSPGTALFLPGVSKETKENFAGSQSNTGEGADATADIEGLQSAIFDKSGGKLYAFTPAKTTYFAYVNVIWKHLCMLAGISNMNSQIASYVTNGATSDIAHIDWGKTVDVGNSLHRILLEQTGVSGGQKAASGLMENFKAWLGDTSFLASLDSTQAYIPFYHDGPITSNDSFDNQTGESMIGQKINEFGGAELMRELAFLTGKSYEAIAEQDDEGNAKQTSDAKSIIKGKLWGIKTIVPDIWKDASSSSREHTFTFRFACAEGSMECYAMQCLRPLAHLLANTLPIHSVGNFGFSAPLLCRVYARGISNIDVGMITSLSIQKDPKSVAANGIMTDMTVTVTVKDLTPIVALPHSRNGFRAQTAVGYISVLGGLAGVNATMFPWQNLEVKIGLDGLKTLLSPTANIAGFGRYVSDKIGAIKVWFRN